MNTHCHPNRSPRHMSLVAATALLIAGATTARADSPFWRSSPASHAEVDGSIVNVQVRVDGATAPLFFKPGTWDRHYFQAYQGRNYSLVVRNTTGRRIGVLIAVDGLNVVNGEKSNLERNEAMYVLGPWEQAEINGWRTSLNEVRRFVFVDEERSYATRTGQSNGDMGWIRVLGFREVEHRAWWPGLRQRRYDGREDDSKERGSNELQGKAPAPQAQAAPAPSADGSALGGLDKSMARSEAKAYGQSDSRHDSPPISYSA